MSAPVVGLYREVVLSADDPVTVGSLFVIDGTPTISPVDGLVSDLLIALGLDASTEVRTIDLFARAGAFHDGLDIFET